MKRIEKFETLQKHAWYSKVWRQAAPIDLVFCRSFLLDNESLDENKFAEKVNRIGISSKLPEGCNAGFICDLLLATLTPKINRRN